jgi:hypothetical protein
VITLKKYRQDNKRYWIEREGSNGRLDVQVCKIEPGNKEQYTITKKVREIPQGALVINCTVS